MLRALMITYSAVVASGILARVVYVVATRRTRDVAWKSSGYAYRPGMRYADESLPERAARRREEVERLRARAGSIETTELPDETPFDLARRA